MRSIVFGVTRLFDSNQCAVHVVSVRNGDTTRISARRTSPEGRPGRYVTEGCQPFSGGCVGGSSHIAHPRGINPFVVEMEECADGDGIVQRLLAPEQAPFDHKSA